MFYQDRHDAGRKLASALGEFASAPETLVLALPRGGVVIGFEIASALELPLDIVCPRKLGAPGNPELAIGAVTETGEGIYQEALIRDLGVSETFLREAIENAAQEARRRLEYYRGDNTPRDLHGMRVIIVDDGIATGSTMRAAIATVKAEGAREIIVAVPVAPQDRAQALRHEVDQLICLQTPATFYAVGQFYDSFEQIDDEEVSHLLSQVLRKPVR